MKPLHGFPENSQTFKLAISYDYLVTMKIFLINLEFKLSTKSKLEENLLSERRSRVDINGEDEIIDFAKNR